MTAPLDTDDAIAAHGEAFLARTLPKSHWTHAGHFAAALYILLRRPDIDAPRDMPALIRAYNEATGVANTDDGGYHETITQASLRAARAFASTQPQNAPLTAILAALLASELGDKNWPLTYWTHTRLFSVEARRAWIDPDLAPLPF